MFGLAATDVRRVRPPLWLVKSGATTAVFVLVFGEIAALPAADPMTLTRAAIGSLAYLATGLQVTVMGLAAMVWLAPRTALGVLAVVGLVLPLGETALGVAWPAVGLLAAATLVSLVWVARRPDGAPLSRPGVPPEGWPLNVARRGVLVGVSAVAASLVVLVGALVWHARDAADTRDFEARASVVTATAVTPDGDDWVFEIGDRQVTRPAPAAVEVTPGMRLGVMVDPEDPDRVAFLAEPEDPSWLLGLAGLTPTLLGMGVGVIEFRRRQDALAVRGGPSRRAVMRPVAKGYALLPLGATAGPALTVKDLKLAHLPPDHVVLPGYGPLRWDEDDAWVEVDDAAGLEADEEEEPDTPLPSDHAELASWADQLQDDLSVLLSMDEFGESGPILLRDVEVNVVGRFVEGDPVALRLDDGRVYLGVLTVPWRTPGPPRHGQAARETAPGSDAVALPAHAPESLPLATRLALTDWLRARARPLRWVAVPVAVAVAFVGIWLVEGADWAWWEWLRVALAAVMLAAAPVYVSSWLGDEGVCRDPNGIRVLGVWLDDVIGSAHVVTVTSGRRSVGVRLKDPDGVLSLDPASFREDGRPNPDRAAALIQEWIAQAGPTGRHARRPTPGLIGVLVVLTIWAVMAVTTLVG